ncbi:MAG: hypothetical protein KIT22_12195 [Verrucomicrobiae bacterium]|nr:hypothetical protein [Verrucomicrobiae bacterium]
MQLKRGRWVGLGIVLVAVVCGALVAMAIWDRRKTGSPPDSPSLVFLGADGSAPFGMAAFALHNPSSSAAIFLHRTEVQVLEQGTWRTESDDPVQVVYRKWPHLMGAALCEPGTGCTVTTPWPKSGPWRVRIVFQPESKSARWIQRAWKVVRFRDGSFWKARQWGNLHRVAGPLVFDQPHEDLLEPSLAPISLAWDAPRLPSIGVIPAPARMPMARSNAPSATAHAVGGEDPLRRR